MSNFKIKLIILTIAFILGLILLQTVAYASNENIQILEKDANNYLIYIKDNEATDFKFAFSNDKNADKQTLNFRSAGTDSKESNANKVAYIDSETQDSKFLWVREGDNYILEGVEIDLSKAIKDTDLQTAASITKTIEADATKTATTEKEDNGKKVTVTVGEVVLKDENGNYSYIIIKLPSSDEYNNLMKLATKISKFNSKTDMYTQIEAYSEFLKLFNSLKPNAEAGWIKADKNIIYQPEDAEENDEYVVWIKDNKTEDIDVQFLTSTKQYSEEKIKEKITTALPVTYDNNILLLVFAILIVLIIAVSIRIKYLNKKEN